MTPDNTPIIVGIGQHSARPDTPPDASEPLVMMERVARAALSDSGSSRLSRELDSVRVVNVLSWAYRRAAHLLAERLGFPPGERLYSTIGGNTPQWLVNRTAEALSAGEIRVALLVGADAWYSASHASRQEKSLDWTPQEDVGPRDRAVGDRQLGWGEVEATHEVTLPVRAFALFENALRAQLGLSLDEHRQRLGKLCARFAAVASKNPHAWFQDGKGEEEITTVTDENRMIAFPYPKFMNAIMAVNQAAAVVMTSVAVARRLDIPRDKWVYLVGAGDAYGTFQISQRRDFVSSPGLRLAAKRALVQAQVDVEAIDLLDLYSCFPIVPQMAAREIGLDLDGGLPPTVTGGLAYFGGPGNNYSMHAIATMVDKLRRAEGRLALVYALGWYFAKHAVGLYSSEPCRRTFKRGEPLPNHGHGQSDGGVAIAQHAEGPARIETYTVVHDRRGEPTLGIVIGKLDDGKRFVANTPADRDLLLAFERTEMVATSGKVKHDPVTRRNIFYPSGF